MQTKDNTIDLPNISKLNRAQRRAKIKSQKKQNKKIKQYIINHPEAIKIEIDEDKFQSLESTNI